ncbi:chromosome transmission fidelity protein 18 homolog [Ornithodoros turicata]|uniref:chromosome transmission fidelity protein 18 homolog n=1 Tax=Ornithodoros turicata TaxID=34597 RepID=UPI003138ADD8
MYEYDEFEDLYADELELADELHGSPHHPTSRVLEKRNDAHESDTPFSGSTKRSQSESDFGTYKTPTVESARKKLKLDDDTQQSSGLPSPPPPLVIDERDLNEAGPSGLCSFSGPGESVTTVDNFDASEPVFTETSSYVMSCSVRGAGNRLTFLGLRDEDWADDEEELHNRSKHRGNLLSRPFWDLWTEAKDELEKREKAEAKTSEIIINHALEHLPEGVIRESGFGDPDDKDRSEAALWVEKYRPKRFMELLSDDGVNRTLLHWLKLWDTVVFGRQPKIKRLKDNQQQQQSNFVRKLLPEVNEELDEHKRPQQKVVLLCGPPGLGKTTLAHVIAKHAGYCVVELNASDDRSPEVFRTTLEAATQMKAVLGQDPRPNCLVIDEIDGAPAPSINVLVNMIKSGGPPAGAAKKRKKEPSLLLRPVICICNDLYVPALRPLRQIALILHFPQMHRARLASRLYEIMRHERMKGDQAAIVALCNKAANDVRSCLSTLQFIRSRKQQLTLTDIETFNVGQKDVQRGLLSVLQDVFQKPRQQKKDFGSSYSEDVANSRTKEALKFDSLVRCAQAFGDYEKLVQGLFDNYVHINFKDPRFEAIQLGPEWLCFVDQMMHVVQHHQNYSLYTYLPFVAPAFFSSFAVVQYTKMTFQNSFIEARMKRSQLNNTLNSLSAEMAPQVSCFLTEQTITLDILPWLVVIMQPTIRPVNVQLFNAEEQKQLRQVISVMLSYNLVYQQARNADGIYQYALEPNIEDIVRFPGIAAPQPLTYGTKQLIARELELEKMRRSDAPETSTGRVAPPKPAVATTVTKPRPAVKEEPLKPAVDFFGRLIQKKEVESTSQASGTASSHSSQVWYQFKEGYSNAVRRTVRMKDLL